MSDNLEAVFVDIFPIKLQVVDSHQEVLAKAPC